MINITFLFVIIFLAAVLFLLKNLFKISLKAFRLYAWQLLSLGFMVLLIRWVVSGAWYEFLPHFLFLDTPLLLLVAPVCYFMYRSTKSKRFQPGADLYKHLLPALVVFLSLLPVYVLSAASKLKLYMEPPVWLNIFSWVFFPQFLFYVLLILRNHQRSKIVRNNMVVGLAIMTLLFVMSLSAQSLFWSFLSVSALCLTVLLHWRHMIPHISNHAEGTELSLLQQSLRSMDQQKLFLRQDLNLSMLAQHLNTSTNKLSHVLNHELGMGFNDWLNSYRVKEVIRLLESNANRQYTLEAISAMAGFRSMTTFNKAFKKHTGQTPGKYHF